jgi:acyl carrier protein
MDDDLRTTVVAALTAVAPEVDGQLLKPGVNFRDQVDLDSMDFVNFVLELERRLGRKIPELDYPRLSSLDGCLSYLTARTAG